VKSAVQRQLPPTFLGRVSPEPREYLFMARRGRRVRRIPPPAPCPHRHTTLRRNEVVGAFRPRPRANVLGRVASRDRGPESPRTRGTGARGLIKFMESLSELRPVLLVCLAFFPSSWKTSGVIRNLDNAH
jgi:hypothetical protein